MQFVLIMVLQGTTVLKLLKDTCGNTFLIPGPPHTPNSNSFIAAGIGKASVEQGTNMILHPGVFAKTNRNPKKHFCSTTGS